MSLPVVLNCASTFALVLGSAALPLVPASAVPRPVVSPTVAPTPTRAPQPGAAGIGDPLYPNLGNGGYDARHYDLKLRYASAAPSQGIDGTVVMRAKAKQTLSRFDLDFGGDAFGEVTVDGRRATASRVGEDLVITPARTIRKGATFRVRVNDFTSHPSTPDPDVFLGQAFVQTPDGSATAGQPDLMHDVFPCNDHPRDKATFSVRFDVPKEQTAVANGVLTGRRTKAGRSVWTYEQRQPMATELVQLAVGKYTVIDRGSVGKVGVRDVVPTRLLAQYRTNLGVEKTQLQWMESKVGAYPFRTYGSLVVDTRLGFALETQTLSLYDTPWFTDYPRGVWDPVMLHELSHQWFGDSVAPRSWSDVWQNEGHASWYEFTYAAEHGYLADDTGIAHLTDLMRTVYSLGDQFRAADGPVARPLSGDPEALFNSNVYYGGALVLYALRARIGKASFERVERAWVARNRGKSASTEDFIRLATKVSKDPGVDPFLREWLYSETTPPMPGHPDWTVDPVQTGGERASARSTQLLKPIVHR
ncbi:MAG: M1 family metallopeptidase [Janthinobacterium lividum]